MFVIQKWLLVVVIFLGTLLKHTVNVRHLLEYECTQLWY